MDDFQLNQFPLGVLLPSVLEEKYWGHVAQVTYKRNVFPSPNQQYQNADGNKQ